MSKTKYLCFALLQIQNDFEHQYFGPVQKVLLCMSLKQFLGKILSSYKGASINDVGPFFGFYDPLPPP